ncbi:MAG TPA: cation diffusion facilitator family transporter [Euzebyales bacterium]|nr:cation diffusion facilitator family transporter [Euzebyales bacterium]
MGRHHDAYPAVTDAHVAGRRRRALRIALGLNGGFMFAELIGGFVFGSLALLADAAHMLSDVAGLAVALVAQHLIDRPASVRHTFGLHRAEVLGAQANGVLLLASAGWILFEAVRRLSDPPVVAGRGVLIVAVLGLAINIGSAVLLARASGRSLNMRGAYAHMLADAAGSVGVIVAAVAVITAGAYWVDPVASMFIGLLVVATAWGLLRDTTHVLLEGVPDSIDPAEVERWLAAAPGVSSVHHLHLWNLTSETAALSAHVVLEGQPTLHQAQARGDVLKDRLADEFAIVHSTLELECHQCEAEAMSGSDGADGEASQAQRVEHD